jgi:hypothetical protein
MNNYKEILSDIQLSNKILNEMILKAKEQGAQNFQMLFSLSDGLTELYQTLIIENKLSRPFYEKWDSLMGWVPKVFEDHPLLELLQKIDNVVMKSRV